MTGSHPWHLIAPGDHAPEVVTGIIEIPTACKAKYELHKDSGLLHLDRVLFSSVHYPANYGFIPQTFCDDKDPLDILVLSQITIQPLCMVDAKVIGAMQMVDQGEHDDKIIAVAANDMSVQHYNDVAELPDHLLSELRGFFEDYKKLEKKTVLVDQFVGRDRARQIVSESIDLYQEVFAGKKQSCAA